MLKMLNIKARLTSHPCGPLVCGVVSIVLLVSGCQSKFLHQHPEFIKHPSQIHIIAVLQPRLEIVEATLLGHVNKNENLNKTRSALAESLATLLRLNGFTARELTDQEMQQAEFGRLQASHKYLSDRVFTAKTDQPIVLSDYFTVPTTEINAAQVAPVVDAYLYSSTKIKCPSTGTVVVGQILMLAAGAATHSTSVEPINSGCGSRIEVILIRRGTMEVLWANKISLTTFSAELIAESALENFPRIMER